MASTTPSRSIPRRAVSQPIQRPASTSQSQIETLYNHPSARIISFMASSKSASRPGSSSDSPRVEEEAGTLPWASKLERTIAVGPLSIYRAPGSVAFLNCSHVLRPILLKSQCWEVDGIGKFVLQIRPPQYWRIEVQSQSDDDKARVEELKDVLEKVLLFEKTPCPFKRNFTVELPKPPLTPVKKRPWKPIEKPKLVIEPITSHREDVTFTSRGSSKERSWPSTPTTDTAHTRSPSPFHDSRPSTSTTLSTDGNDLPKHEDASDISTRCASEPRPDQITPPDLLLSNPLDSVFNGWAEFEEDGESFSDATDDTNMTPRAQLPSSTQSTLYEPEMRSRPQAIQNCSRSITAPPVLSLVTSRASKLKTTSPLESPKNAEICSIFSSSVESFHSVQSWHSPLPSPSPSPMTSEFSSSIPTYPYPHHNIALPKQRERDASETPITPGTPHMWETASTDSDSIPRSPSPPPQTPTLVNDANEKSDEELFEAITPPTTIRSRVRHHVLASDTSRRRGLSPLPAAANLFSPPRKRLGSLQTAKHLPTAIIQKTYEILVSPPSHLLHLMLNITSKIAAGEWRGVLPGPGDMHWDFEDEYGVTEWTEDDYGIGLFNTQGKPDNEATSSRGGSWEVD